MGTPTEVRLVTYQDEYAQDFAALNYEWSEQYFVVEEEDRKALEHPRDYAINKGGEIFFVLEDDRVVGTVAMVPHRWDDVRVFELAKMAVRPDRQGRGYSRMLMDACLEFARARGADEIMLVTNDVLSPAMGLYESAGFQREPIMADQRYDRGNTQMTLVLQAEDTAS